MRNPSSAWLLLFGLFPTSRSCLLHLKWFDPDNPHVKNIIEIPVMYVSRCTLQQKRGVFANAIVHVWRVSHQREAGMYTHDYNNYGDHKQGFTNNNKLRYSPDSSLDGTQAPLTS